MLNQILETAANVVAAINNLAEAINNVAKAQVITGATQETTGSAKAGLVDFKKAAAEKRKAKEEIPEVESPKERIKEQAEAAETAPEPEAKGETREVTANDLRKIGTALVDAGKKGEFLAALAAAEAKNISALAEDKRAEMLTTLEGLLGKKLEEIAD